jgi:hypothetical protein
MTDEAPIIFYREADWCCAGWGRLFMQVWHGEVNAERAQIVCDAMVQFARESGQGVVTVIILGPQSKAPDAGARAVFASEARRLEQGLRGAAYVVAVPGFHGAAVRSVLTALHMVAREAFPSRVFGRTGDASRWLAELLASAPDGVQPLATDIERTLDRFTSGQLPES